MPQVAVRCRNSRVHKRLDGLGNILCVLSGADIYVRCTDCRRWTRLRIAIPGVKKLSLDKAAVSQLTIQGACRFDLQRAAVAVEGD